MEGRTLMAALTSITTNIAREKMVKARAGEILLPPIKVMAFGRGGVDIDGNVLEPAATQKALVEEIGRKTIEKYTFPVPTTCRYVCRIPRGELGGEDISEVGLVDEAGDLVSVKNFSKKGKDSDMEMIFEIDDEF